MEIEGIHLFALALTALAILYSDYQGFLYFRGKKQLLSKPFVIWSHRLVWVGLSAMIVTGVSLALPRLERLLEEPAFYVKMGFVLVLVVNAFVIGKLSHVATVRPFVELTKGERSVLMLSGGLSVCGWLGATAISFLFL